MIKKSIIFATLALISGVLFIAPDALAAQPAEWQLGLQDAASPSAERITEFHNMLLYIITGITYPDHDGMAFSSYMIEDADIDEKKGQVRLLSTDNPVVLPIDTDIQVLVTAGDVRFWQRLRQKTQLQMSRQRHNKI